MRSDLCQKKIALLTQLPIRVCIPHTLTDFCANMPRQLTTTSDDWYSFDTVVNPIENPVVSCVVYPQL